jgi:hypothetical protein
MRYVVSESQFRKLSESILNESKEIRGCMVFQDMNQREFCRSAEKLIADEMDTGYSASMENLLKTYFSSDDRIKNIEIEYLNDESPIVLKGFEQIDEVVEKLKRNCPRASEISKELKKKWLSEYNVYFKDNQGNYHLLNRLDTNYTAMAVLITIYYENLINQVRSWITRKKTPSELFVRNWVEHFFNTNVELIDPRKGWERDVLGSSKPLEELPHPTSIFNKVLTSKEIVVDESDYHRSFMSALEDVRNKGFKTEDLFEKMLKQHDIENIRYSGDYSFVDMVLGIDFLIKQKRKGEDYWVPVQVKSSFTERYNLVDKFKCTKVIKPELTSIDGRQDFKIGDIRGFEEYFCEEHNYCKASDKERKYASPSYDYLSSKEFLSDN